MIRFSPRSGVCGSEALCMSFVPGSGIRTDLADLHVPVAVVLRHHERSRWRSARWLPYGGVTSSHPPRQNALRSCNFDSSSAKRSVSRLSLCQRAERCVCFRTCPLAEVFRGEYWSECTTAASDPSPPEQKCGRCGHVARSHRGKNELT